LVIFYNHKKRERMLYFTSEGCCALQLNNWTFLVIIFKPFKKGIDLFTDFFIRNATQSFFTSLVKHLAYLFALLTSCVAFDIFLENFLTKSY
jgi:hypothetical protein